eukprot:4947212-Pyramimonas_sp.AAC.1
MWAPGADGPNRILTSHKEVGNHMQGHFCKVEFGKQRQIQQLVEEFNQMPELLPVAVEREAAILPTALDIEHIVRGVHPTKAPGPDGFPPQLFKAAPKAIAATLCPIFAKIAMTSREPIASKLGEVTYF